MIDLIAAVNGSLDMMESKLRIEHIVSAAEAARMTTELTGCIDRNFTDAVACYRAILPADTPDEFRVMFIDIWNMVGEAKGEWVRAHPAARSVPSYRDLSLVP